MARASLVFFLSRGYGKKKEGVKKKKGERAEKEKHARQNRPRSGEIPRAGSTLSFPFLVISIYLLELRVLFLKSAPPTDVVVAVIVAVVLAAVARKKKKKRETRFPLFLFLERGLQQRHRLLAPLALRLVQRRRPPSVLDQRTGPGAEQRLDDRRVALGGGEVDRRPVFRFSFFLRLFRFMAVRKSLTN